MASPTEQYYEGTIAPNKARRWLFLGGGLALIVLLGLFVKSTLPSQRAEFVGRWKGTTVNGLWYDFRPDGTFSGVVELIWLGATPRMQVRCDGKWSATHDSLYLTVEHYEPVAKPTSKREFDARRRDVLSRPQNKHINWTSANEWTDSWASNGSFTREK